MSTSVLYTSEDSGAPNPAYSTSLGAVNSIFQAVLVDGYGGKSPLGWTREFYDAGANISVFRNNSTKGSGCFLFIQDNGVPLTINYLSRMYSSMSSLFSGVNAIPPLSYVKNRKNHTSSNTYPFKWRIIGDDRGFYFIISNAFQGYSDPIVAPSAWVVYFGDIISFYPKEDKVFGGFCNDDTTQGFGSLVGTTITSINDTNQHSMINRNPITGKIGALSVRMISMNPFYNTATISVGDVASKNPIINDVPYLMDNVLVLPDKNIIGKLPGFYSPMYCTDDAAMEKYYVERILVSGENSYLCTHMQMSTLNAGGMSSMGAMAFKIGKGFRP